MHSFTLFKFFIHLGNLSTLRPHFNALGIKKKYLINSIVILSHSLITTSHNITR